MKTKPLHFVRRGKIVTLPDVDPNRTLLEVLREDLHCTGTKEGCGEGDCGACTVVIGQADGERVKYSAINSCIRLAHSVDGMAVWTAEDIAPTLATACAALPPEGAQADLGRPGVGLIAPTEDHPTAGSLGSGALCAGQGGARKAGGGHGAERSAAQAPNPLHPAQQAMVDCHGSQCGFCTPGFVMSLFGLYQNTTARGKTFSRDQAMGALSGNLCRCTGYRPILDAAVAMQALPLVQQNEAEVLLNLELLAMVNRGLEADLAYMSPSSLADLLTARKRYPEAQLVAGCTDVGLWVTKMHQQFERVLDLTQVAELGRVEDYPHHIAIGAAVTLTDAFVALVADRPQLAEFAHRFAGLPVRNSGTLGGNVANGSPIGDSMPLLIALGASVVLMRMGDTQIAHRELALEDLYTGYRTNVIAKDEVVAWIKVPKATATEFSRVYKISKRFEDDISAVCLALNLHIENGKVRKASIGVGGVAATPVRAIKTEAAIQGKTWARTTIDLAMQVLRAEFSPISDMRASAAYRTTVLGNLLQRFWLENQSMSLVGFLGSDSNFHAQHPQGTPNGRWKLDSDPNKPVHTNTTSSCGTSQPHESAAAQVAGAVSYIDDIPEVRGTLHAAPILSNVAHGRLLGVDATAALTMPGVVDVVLAQDIPGDPMLAAFAGDEPVFAADTVQHIGQVIGLVIAKTVMQARRAARKVQLSIEALPAILTVEQALQAKNYVLPPVFVRRGDADSAIARAQHTLSGTLEVGGQEHFYLEGQIAYVLPQEQSQWVVHSSTQHPGEVQHWVAHALGIDNHAVRVECRRMGGGFGGKETQAGHLAVWAAVAAAKLQCAIKLRLDRDDDFMVTGKRHPFAYEYTAGFDDTGRLTALKLMMAANCGFSADLSGPVADRAIFHSDNAYYLQDVEIASYRCKTNTQSHTAFRGFGGPQGVIVIETIMGDIARQLKMDPLDVRLRNLYCDETVPGTDQRRDTTHYQMKVEDNILAPLLSKLELSAQYRSRREAQMAWNAANPIIKHGLAITPVKFGISFTATLFNQAGALVHVYTDGSVQVNHGGTEMGQGLHTKVAQIVADELGIAFDRVLCTASDTSKIPNASATAASAGTDLNGRAAQFAARHVRDNLAAFVCGLDGCGAGAIRFEGGHIISPSKTRAFTEVVGMAYANRIQLWSDGFYRTPKIHYDKATLTGRPFYYFAYGAACTEVAIDTLTGESRVLKVDILHDVGRSINPAIDIGQIEGAFVQGMGWLTTEQLVWNDKGLLTTHAPSTYKIPTAGDVPEHFKVDLWPEPNREDNVFGSKAVGEPPFMLAISVYEALRDAIASVGSDGPVRLSAPATAENVLRALAGRDT